MMPDGAPRGGALRAPAEPASPAIAENPGLAEERARITELDTRTVALLAERVRLARSLGRRKQAAGVDVYDPAREAAVVRHAAATAAELGLDPEGVRELFWRIVRMSRQAQREEA